MAIIPRSGRDYASAALVRAAFYSGVDFIVADMSSPWDGKPVNDRDLRNAGVINVNVRYAGLRKLITLPTTE